MPTLVPHEADFTANNLSRIRRVTSPEETAVLSVFAPNNKDQNTSSRKLTDLKGEIGKFTNRIRDFSILFRVARCISQPPLPQSWGLTPPPPLRYCPHPFPLMMVKLSFWGFALAYEQCLPALPCCHPGWTTNVGLYFLFFLQNSFCFYSWNIKLKF